MNPYDLRAKLMFGDLPSLPSETADDIYSWSLESRCSLDSYLSLSATASLAAPSLLKLPAAPAPSPSRSSQRLLARLTAIPSACRGILRRRAAFTSGPIMPVEQTEVAPGPHGPSQCTNAWPEVTELGHLLEARPVSWDSAIIQLFWSIIRAIRSELRLVYLLIRIVIITIQIAVVST
ncbi:unnamed protein product [Penicillium bialowiezense]